MKNNCSQQQTVCWRNHAEKLSWKVRPRVVANNEAESCNMPGSWKTAFVSKPCKPQINVARLLENHLRFQTVYAVCTSENWTNLNWPSHGNKTLQWCQCLQWINLFNVSVMLAVCREIMNFTIFIKLPFCIQGNFEVPPSCFATHLGLIPRPPLTCLGTHAGSATFCHGILRLSHHTAFQNRIPTTFKICYLFLSKKMFSFFAFLGVFVFVRLFFVSFFHSFSDFHSFGGCICSSFVLSFFIPFQIFTLLAVVFVRPFFRFFFSFLFRFSIFWPLYLFVLFFVSFFPFLFRFSLFPDADSRDCRIQCVG